VQGAESGEADERDACKEGDEVDERRRARRRGAAEHDYVEPSTFNNSLACGAAREQTERQSERRGQRAGPTFRKRRKD